MSVWPSDPVVGPHKPGIHSTAGLLLVQTGPQLPLALQSQAVSLERPGEGDRKEKERRGWEERKDVKTVMRTPRTPRDGAKRDRLPKIGEETAGSASVGCEDGDRAALDQGTLDGDTEWEHLDLNGSGLEDTPSKSAPEESPAENEPEVCEDGAARDLTACAGAAEAGSDECTPSETAAGATASNAGAEQNCVGEHQESGEDCETKSSPSPGAEDGGDKEHGHRIKTLKDYVEGSARSPRGADLEQITVRARSFVLCFWRIVRDIEPLFRRHLRGARISQRSNLRASTSMVSTPRCWIARLRVSIMARGELTQMRRKSKMTPTCTRSLPLESCPRRKMPSLRPKTEELRLEATKRSTTVLFCNGVRRRACTRFLSRRSLIAVCHLQAVAPARAQP